MVAFLHESVPSPPSFCVIEARLQMPLRLNPTVSKSQPLHLKLNHQHSKLISGRLDPAQAADCPRTRQEGIDHEGHRYLFLPTQLTTPHVLEWAPSIQHDSPKSQRVHSNVTISTEHGCAKYRGIKQPVRLLGLCIVRRLASDVGGRGVFVGAV